MLWREAWDLMKKGCKMKLPSWGGFWEFNSDTERIEMHCKDGTIIDIGDTDRVLYTYDNIASDKWLVATPDNTPILGGTAYFDFSEALLYIKRGLKLTCEDTMKSGEYVQMKDGLVFINRIISDIKPYISYWKASQEELFSTKWKFY